jgi:phosphonate transport system substrate-binding protein
MVARVVLILCLVAAVAYVGNAAWQTHNANESQKQSEDSSVRATGLVNAVAKHLAPQFTDVEGNLIADTPTDASKLVDPPAFVIGHLPDSDKENISDIDWPSLDKHLTEAMGRPVTDITVENGPQQVEKIKAGQINIMALHAADAPFLVNNCGYHPVAVMGDESGVSGNRLDLVVPANSPIQHPADLRGHTLTCSGPLSIVGYRAAIVRLMQNDKLRPNVDYYVAWSQGQKESIAAVISGSCEAAAISDDKLHSELAKGHVKVDVTTDKGTTSQKVPITSSMYRIIDQSDVFPRTTIGYFYNLKPETAAKLKAAILSYKPVATADEDSPMHFIPVDYKKDFALIRMIDDQFDPRLEPKAKREVPATQAVLAQ